MFDKKIVIPLTIKPVTVLLSIKSRHNGKKDTIKKNKNYKSFQHDLSEPNTLREQIYITAARRELSWSVRVATDKAYFSGMMKCSRDQSSFSEFCSGVPVIRSL